MSVFFWLLFLICLITIRNQQMILSYRPSSKKYSKLLDQNSDDSCVVPVNNTDSTVGLGNCYYFGLYYVTLGIGTPPQYFNVQFDTGSDVLWIPTTSTNPNGFNQTGSSSLQIKNTTQNISYQSNSYVYGNNGKDYVTLRNTQIKSFCPLLLASQVVDFSYPPSVLGIAGMGYSNDQNFIQVSYRNGLLKSNAFTLSLRPQNQNSIMFYNEIPEQILNSTLYAPVLGQTLYWQVSLIGFFVGENQWTNYAADIAVIDSGTTLFYLNTNLQSQFVQVYLPTSQCNFTNGLIICNSSIVQNLPNLTFMFPGVSVFLQVNDYVQCFNETCYVHIYSVDTTPAEVLLGDTLFLKYNITFDKSGTQVGFMGDTQKIIILGDQNFKLSQYIMIGIEGIIVLLIITGFCVLPQGMSRQNQNYQMKQNLLAHGGRRATELSEKITIRQN